MGNTKKAALDDDCTLVWLGNRNTIEIVDDPDDSVDAALAEGRGVRRIRRKADGAPKKNCTTFRVPPDWRLMETASAITHPGQGAWQAHSDDEAPAWVASTDPALAQLLAQHWGCELRDPEPAGSGDENAEG